MAIGFTASLEFNGWLRWEYYSGEKCRRISQRLNCWNIILFD